MKKVSKDLEEDIPHCDDCGGVINRYRVLANLLNTWTNVSNSQEKAIYFLWWLFLVVTPQP